MDSTLVLIGIVAAILFIVISLIIAISLRRVVAPNEVHIVQSRKATTSYGKDTQNGNSYYEWPAWIPAIGVTTTTLPVSVFDVRLNNYEAYDQGRVPFVVDVIGFYRINDTNLAAQRVQTFKELEGQLISITQGAIRTVLASHEIDSIMVDRSKFGSQFTLEVQDQLTNWGVIPVKNLELMDIRDVEDGLSIHNIMEKKKSLIEMQSRVEVAKNKKDAQVAEILAQQQAEVQKQESLQAIGLRTASKEQQVGIAQQQATQAIQEQTRMTKEKEMAVTRVAQVQQAQIDKESNVVKAEQTKQVTILTAEGNLEQQKRMAEGVQIAGVAKAEAEKALQLAPVQAQITLAKEIGGNEGYQKYLITIRQVEAGQIVGVEQAKALEHADIKIIANSGDPVSGIASVRDIFSSKGGTSIGAMLEGLAQTEQGKNIVDLVTKGSKGTPKA